LGNNIIFIGGTGRSGTHLIGRTISSHPNIYGRIERKNTFELFTKLATSDRLGNFQKFFLKARLRIIFKIIGTKINSSILEKTHTSLWSYKWIFKTYPNSKMVVVWRNSKPTINSMLNHAGVLSWYDKLDLTTTNQFLGITEENRTNFKELSIEKKCFYRWASHMEQILNAKNEFPDNVFLVNYDSFLINIDSHLELISKFLKIENNFRPEKIKYNSRDKWKTELTVNQIHSIESLEKDYTYLMHELFRHTKINL
jgi:hypothetical protein